MAAYVLEGPRWAAGQTGSVTVTWAADASIPLAFLSEIIRAFTDWASYAAISFRQVSSTAGANITFSDSRIDGLDATLAQTDYSYSGQRFSSAHITFDSGEGWHASTGGLVSDDRITLFPVALHEIGHAIGLDHYNATPAVMNAIIDRSVTDLTASDIAGVQALYGVLPAAPQASPPVASLPAASQASAATHDVFRFYNAATHDHFYTSDAGERDTILRTLPAYSYEGTPWSTPDRSADTVDVFRFYNAATGDHFFTTSAAERDSIVAHLPGYHYEGVAFEAYAGPAAAGAGAAPLERFYNAALGVHHYAPSQEADAIRHGAAGAGWVDEGLGMIVHTPSGGMLLA